MSQTAVKKLKNSWHRARNFHKLINLYWFGLIDIPFGSAHLTSQPVKKNAEGAVTKSSTPGATLKSWAKNQIETSGPHAEECQQWLKNKKTLAQQSRKQK
jgi:hypothetical protein